MQVEGMTKTAHAGYYILRVNVVIILKTYIALKSQAPRTRAQKLIKTESLFIFKSRGRARVNINQSDGPPRI